MKDNIFFLEAVLENTCLKIGLHKGESVWTYEEKEISKDDIKSIPDKLITILNSFHRNRNNNKNCFEQIMNSGRLLADELLSPLIKSRLQSTNIENLIIRIDDHLVHIPWELLCIENEFLCQRFNIGREVRTRQNTVDLQKRTLQKPLQMWIITDPYNNLSQTIQEGRKICGFMDSLNNEDNITIEALHQSQVIAHDIKEKIRNYDLVHFAGHVEYNKDYPDESGWHLSDTIFKASDIIKLTGSGSMPSFIFSNACQSARTDSWNKKKYNYSSIQNSFGLANAFMISGVQHYIGTICEIVDIEGSQFANYFYKELAEGKSIGESVKLARKNIINESPNDIGWASYLLYGNPTVSYFKKDQNIIRENKKQKFDINEISTNELNQPDKIYQKNSDLRSRWSKSDQSSINIKITKKQLLFFLIISIAAIYMLFANITNQVTNIVDQIPKNIKITLENNADKKQKKFLNLFEKYKQLVKPDVNDQWTSAKVAIFTGNISKNKYNEDIMVLDALTKKIIDSKLNIDVIQRGEPFEEILLPEKVKNLELEGYTKINRAKQTILKAKLVLIINMVNYTDKLFWLIKKEKKAISMRLVDIESNKILDIFYENINAEQPFFKNKKIFDDLITRLKKIIPLYPIKGIISSVNPKSIKMNIGESYGVKAGQYYQVKDEDIVFEVIAVESDSCSLTPVKSNQKATKGWKLSFLNSPPISKVSIIKAPSGNIRKDTIPTKNMQRKIR